MRVQQRTQSRSSGLMRAGFPKLAYWILPGTQERGGALSLQEGGQVTSSDDEKQG